MFGLPSWAVNLLGGVALAAVVAGCGAHLAQVWYAPQITALKAVQHEQTVAAKATAVVQATLTKADSAAEHVAQTRIIRQVRTIIKKVPTYVSSSPRPPVGCVTVGMLRLHDAAASGADPADLHPPAGESDDACSTVSPSDFMAVVAGNYAAARENGEQLNSLEADIRARVAAVDLLPK